MHHKNQVLKKCFNVALDNRVWCFKYGGIEVLRFFLVAKEIQFCVVKSKQKLKNKTFTLSDQSINSYGFIVLTSGIILDTFKKNPVMLFNHNPDVVPGRWDDIRVEGTNLIADSFFDESDEESKKLSNKVKEGFIKGVSVGFQILEWQMGGIPGFEDVPVVSKCLLREASITPIPSNGNALVLYDKDGVKLNNDQVLTLLNSNQNPKIDMKKLEFFIAALSLAAESTEDQVLAAIRKVVSDNAQLTADLEIAKKALKTANDAAIVAKETQKKELIDGAIAAGKITEKQRDQYTKLATADFDTTKSILDGMKGHVSLSSQVNNGGDAGKGDKYKDWTFKKYQKEAPTELTRLKAEEPAKYKELFDAEYSKA